jgi:hypothetical protein
MINFKFLIANSCPIGKNICRKIKQILQAAPAAIDIGSVAKRILKR